MTILLKSFNFAASLDETETLFCAFPAFMCVAMFSFI